MTRTSKLSHLLKRAHVVTLLLALCAPVAHGAIGCTGEVSYLGLGPSGLVQVSNGHGVWYLCELSASYNGYAPEACRGIYAALLAAKAMNRPVTFYFDVPPSTSCSSFGSWVVPSPVPYHFNAAVAD